MQRKLLTKITIGVLVSAILAGNASAESLRGALVAAYNNSNLLAQNRALLRGSDENVAVALSQLRPQLSAQGAVTRVEPTFGSDNLRKTIDLILNVPLYTGGANRLNLDAAKEAVLAARQSLVAQEQQVLLQAVQAYLSVQRDLRVVSLRQNNLRLLGQELAAAQDRFDVGEVTRTDVAQAQARLAGARGARSAAQGDLEISRELYQLAIGQKPGKLAPIRGLPKLPGSLDRARAIGAQLNPAIRQSQHEVKANELTAEATKARTRPTLSLRGTTGYSDTQEENNTIGLQLSIPIYQGGQLNALHRQALSQVHASRFGLNQTALAVRQGVGNSWSQLSVARAQVQASQRQVRAAQVAFNGVREEAKLGARTTLDVLDAEQALLDARTNQIVFETQVFAAAYGLLSSMGQLTVSNLNLPVETYDPAEYYNSAKRAPVRISPQGRKLDRLLGRYSK